MIHVPTVALFALGCKVNQAELEEWQREFRAVGYDVVGFDERADVYVLNTCSVTHVADRKSRQLLRQAVRRNPDALLVATGCYATVARDEIARIAGVDLIVPQAEKARLVEQVVAALDTPIPPAALPRGGRADEAGGGTATSRGGRTRALVKAADGCDKFCAFCIVPYARGRTRSQPLAEVIARVETAAQAGYREVVLTAVNLGVYGQDLTPRLTTRDLVAAVLRETSVERLRVSSIEPEDFDPTMLDLWQEHPGRLCRHFHLALDAGCDATLRRMRRRYTSAEYAAVVQTIRAALPGAAITTDVMVGFPGETDAEFAESVAFVRELGFAQAHVFKYSPRPGTAGAKLPDQVRDAAKKERLEAMIEVAAASASSYRAGLIGGEADVLYEASVEGANEPTWEGLTGNYVRVFAVSREPLANRIVRTRLTGPHPEGLIGAIDQ